MDTPPTTPESRERAEVSIDVAHVARLARLALDDDELARLEHDLRKILAYVDELRELDVRDVPPMSHPLPFSSPYRADEAGQALPQEVAVAASAAADGEAFIVPKVIA
jgi:aspartyl-tRNA(Asn)/glutamyl-tRNA(Gln) amidotransferase subunit C